MTLTPLHYAILNLVQPRSLAEPIGREVLCNELAAKGHKIRPRQVQDRIRELRGEGHCIIGTSGGYWLAQRPEDAEAVFMAERTLRRHGESELAEADELREIAWRLQSQPKREERAAVQISLL